MRCQCHTQPGFVREHYPYYVGVMTDLLTIGIEVPSLRSNVGIDAIVFAMISIWFKKGSNIVVG